MAMFSRTGLVYALTCITALAACGASGPRLRTRVAGEKWYAAATRCGQGPYEVEVESAGARWGEGVELVVHTPRRLQLSGVLLRDGEEIAHFDKLVEPNPSAAERATGPDNQPCVASAIELDASLSGEGEAPIDPGVSTETAEPPADDTGAPPTIEEPVPEAPAPVPPVHTPPSGAGGTTLVARAEGGSSLPALPVIGYSWPSVDAKLPPLPAGARITIRFWSNVPNFLDGVTFTLVHTVEKPTVSDAEYEAYLHERAEKRRQREERARQKAAERASRQSRHHEPARPPTAEEIEASRRAREREIDRAVREEREREQRALEREERERRRHAYCEAHREDTSCWGPGGFAVHADLEARRTERTAYCAAHPLEARCWTPAEWREHRERWNARVRQARQGPPRPDSPPPPPQAEQKPPSPSENATWRPGYWHWTGNMWAWIAGMWRVPEIDIQEERTTRAPAEPPAAKPESPPPAPVVTAVWIPGFWQWDGQAWVWIPGSWQLPPAAHKVWRPARWIGRAGVYVLVPGAWVTVDAPAPRSD